MNKRAMWIFDKDYLMLTYLSVSSFVKHCDVIATLVCCGEEMDKKDKEVFLNLDATVEFYHFDVDVSSYEEHMQANILNRFARLHYTRLFEDDILFMIDSDVVFSADLKDSFLEIEDTYKDSNSLLPKVSGVVEFLSAKDAYLYFKKKNKHDFTLKTPDFSKIQSYRTHFGENWKELIQGFQFNNGFLIFHKARELVDQWEEFYLSGLKDRNVNPLDDQVPLAAAIQKLKCPVWKMDSKWNSLGDLNGPFIMFHAWGGEWKIEIDQVLRNGISTSDYGEICKEFLPACPNKWLDKFFQDLKSFPFRYRHIVGGFDHGTVFTDLLSRLESGHIVEVGTYKGRSACFVAELIKGSEKDIRFETIDHFKREDTSKALVEQNLERAGVKDYVDVIEAESKHAALQYETNQLDFVFLDTESPAEKLWQELEAWYDKVKEGGILGGYDYSIHDTVFKSYDCTIVDFCEKYNLPLRTYEYQFLIRKPETKQTK